MSSMLIEPLETEIEEQTMVINEMRMWNALLLSLSLSLSLAIAIYMSYFFCFYHCANANAQHILYKSRDKANLTLAINDTLLARGSTNVKTTRFEANTNETNQNETMKYNLFMRFA